MTQKFGEQRANTDREIWRSRQVSIMLRDDRTRRPSIR